MKEIPIKITIRFPAMPKESVSSAPPPHLHGDCHGLRGDCSELSGNCSGLRGNLDECEISNEDRAKGIDIATLVRD